MADFPASGRWIIYSIQKTLPYLGQAGAIFGAHNYLALVDPEGVIDSEMQGVYTGRFVLNGPGPGNYLKVRMYDRNEYISAIDEDDLPTDKDVIDGFLDDLNAQLDSLDTLNGTDLLDRLRNLVGRLNEWRDYLLGQMDADSGGGMPRSDDRDNFLDDWQSDEEEREEWEEQSSASHEEDEFEPEREYAWPDPDPQPSDDEDD